MNATKELDQELAELKNFIADLKADRALQKEKERREGWTKYTAISLVFIAVLAAVANQWGYYQAKSIKQNLYEALGEFSGKNGEAVGSGQNPSAFNAKVAKYKAD